MQRVDLIHVYQLLNREVSTANPAGILFAVVLILTDQLGENGHFHNIDSSHP